MGAVADGVTRTTMEASYRHHMGAARGNDVNQSNRNALKAAPTRRDEFEWWPACEPR